MRRFFVPREILAGEELELPTEVLQHLRVLRLNAGMLVELLDGQGTSCTCELLAVERKRALARVKKRTLVSEKTLPLTLYQGLPKGDKLDLVLQKGTELGISRFVPVICERCQPMARSRLPRWQRIVCEAARQSGRVLLPPVEEPSSLAGALASCDGQLRLVPWEESRQPLAEVLPETPPRSVSLLIGPEGGLSRDEIDVATGYGFQPISLGERILRTETAGFAVAGILQYLYGDLGKGRP